MYSCDEFGYSYLHKFFWHKENMLQNSEYILFPTRKEMLLFFTHPYRATWPRGLSAGSGRPCTTRAGPASSRGSKSSWKRNIRFMSQHSTYDALYMLAFTMSMRLRCIRDRTLFARRETSFIMHQNLGRQREKNMLEKTRFSFFYRCAYENARTI